MAVHEHATSRDTLLDERYCRREVTNQTARRCVRYIDYLVRKVLREEWFDSCSYLQDMCYACLLQAMKIRCSFEVSEVEFVCYLVHLMF